MTKTELNTVLFYLRNKRYAIKKILKIVAPVNEDKAEEMQIFYGLYFNSLISIIEFTKEKIENIKDPKNLSVLEKSLIGILGSENNYFYIRELRNSIVHRGYDVANAAIVCRNIISPIAPLTMNNKNNSKIYNKFTNNLFEIVVSAEKLNSFIFIYCKDKNLFEYIPETKETITNEIQTCSSIPDDVKKLALYIEYDIDTMNKGLKEKLDKQIKSCFNTDDLFN